MDMCRSPGTGVTGGYETLGVDTGGTDAGNRTQVIRMLSTAKSSFQVLFVLLRGLV